MPNGLNAEQLKNAAIIYSVGKELGASNRDIQIALITALVESNLINVPYGDRDSLGLFQQRAAWGSVDDRMNPWKSAAMFFQGGQQGQQGLFGVKDRDQRQMGDVAQDVQVSAFPDRYQTKVPLVQDVWNDVAMAAGADVRDLDGRPYGNKKKGRTAQPVENALSAHESSILGAPTFSNLKAQNDGILGAPVQNAFGQNSLLGAQVGPQSAIGPHTNDIVKKMLEESGRPQKGIDGWRGGVVDKAMELVGTPYVWGGADPDGFDCSGLIQYVYSQLGFELPRVSFQQANFGKRTGLKGLRPGDLVAWDNSSRNAGADHIAIYIGNNQIIEAPRPGMGVRVRDLGRDEGAWGVKLNF